MSKMSIANIMLIMWFNLVKICWPQTPGCPSGYWGTNCANTCGTCSASLSCDAVTGSCPSGCAKWYGGDSCSISVAPLDLSSSAPTVFQSANGPNAIITVSWVVFVDPRISASYFFEVEQQLLINSMPMGGWIAVDQVWKNSATNTTHSAGVTGFMQNTTYNVRVASYRAVPGTEERNTVSQSTIYTTQCARDLDGPAVMLTNIVPNGTSHLDVTVEWVYPRYVYVATVDHFKVSIVSVTIDAFTVPLPATGLYSVAIVTIPMGTYYITVAAVTADGCVSQATPSLPLCSVPGGARCVGPQPLLSIPNVGYDIAFAVTCGVLIPLAVASLAWAIYTRLKICTCVGKMTFPLEDKSTATADPVLTRSDLFGEHSISLASNLNVSVHEPGSIAGDSLQGSEDYDQTSTQTISAADKRKLL